MASGETLERNIETTSNKRRHRQKMLQLYSHDQLARLTLPPHDVTVPASAEATRSTPLRSKEEVTFVRPGNLLQIGFQDKGREAKGFPPGFSLPSSRSGR
ncbi:hypothetical protein E2C01_068996 [Portunus trituberculatus]|uniref:Uncharacterized protein n=1 Tax=Portunus trituberculatus TaxID=210409 RepID=A0A5B7I111_PORTR|nr:hypothetical protein [Portunus trituberculatus]